MIPKEIKARYSCRRKSDFVTYFAICFFFVIVALELYLILWIPIQLRREGVLQKHVAKEQMSKKVDAYRGNMRELQKYLLNDEQKNRRDIALKRGEVTLAQNMLDMYANYIRMHQDRLSLPKILEITALLDRYGVLLEYWKNQNFAFVRNEISLQKGMELIEKKNGL